MSEMRVLKGTGVGNDAVMGKLKIVDEDEELFCADTEDREAIFFRTQGIAISRIEEAYEEVSKKEELSYILQVLQKMLEVVKGREFISAINEITQLEISLYEAIEHIEREAVENSITREICLLFKRILKAKSGIDLSDGEGCIGIICDSLDVTELISLGTCGFLGLIFVQSPESPFARVCGSFGIPTLFLSYEKLYELAEGESAILYPTRNVIYISPRIEIVDDFIATMKNETRERGLWGVFKCLLGESVYSVYEYGREEYSGFAIDMTVEERCEEEVFELCRSVAEISGGDVFIIFRNIQGVREYLRGILRAAVYGKISIVTSFASSKEYSDFCDSFSEIKNELTLEKREFDSEIRQGILVDNIFSVLLTDKIVKESQLIFVDVENLAKTSDKSDKKDIIFAIIKLLSNKALMQDKPLFIMGNAEILDERELKEVKNSNQQHIKLCCVKKI